MNGPVVSVTGGEVLGTSQDGVARFLDIPYAAAPVGELRFAAPAPHAPWSGVRDGQRYGPTAPQRHRPFPVIDVKPLIGEGWQPGDDYLTVNVWTPEPSGSGLPVMVFIHGGAFALGSNQAPVQDGAAFARAGVVCMSINYRLGVEGFLPLAGAPTNLGLRDQIAALRWVQDNCAAFGGDPANVTIFGESAGGMSVANLVASPLAKGLFRRAIVQSGHGAMVHSRKVAARLTSRLARILRVAPDVEGFRTRSVEQCLDAVGRVLTPRGRVDMREANGLDPAFGLSPFLPVYGDDVLPVPPIEALRAGAGSGVELMVGTNTEEMNLYFVPTGVRRRIWGWLAAYMLGKAMPRPRQALAAYGLGQSGRRPGDAMTEAMHDLVFRWPARQFAAAHQGQTHVYEFDWRSPACDGQLGACHGIELPFVFNTLATATGPTGLAGLDPPQALADRVQRIWVDFARDGTLHWPQYSAADPQVFDLDANRARREPPMKAAAFLP